MSFVTGLNTGSESVIKVDPGTCTVSVLYSFQRRAHKIPQQALERIQNEKRHIGIMLLTRNKALKEHANVHEAKISQRCPFYPFSYSL